MLTGRRNSYCAIRLRRRVLAHAAPAQLTPDDSNPGTRITFAARLTTSDSRTTHFLNELPGPFPQSIGAWLSLALTAHYAGLLNPG